MNIRSTDWPSLHLRSLGNGTTTDRLVVWSLNISKPQYRHSDERCVWKCILLLATGCSDNEQNYELFTRNEIRARAKYILAFTVLIPHDFIFGASFLSWLEKCGLMKSA